MKNVRYVTLGTEVMRVEIDVNWLNLSKQDRQFVLAIVDLVNDRIAQEAVPA